MEGISAMQVIIFIVAALGTAWLIWLIVKQPAANFYTTWKVVVIIVCILVGMIAVPGLLPKLIDFWGDNLIRKDLTADREDELQSAQMAIGKAFKAIDKSLDEVDSAVPAEDLVVGLEAYVSELKKQLTSKPTDAALRKKVGQSIAELARTKELAASTATIKPPANIDMLEEQVNQAWGYASALALSLHFSADLKAKIREQQRSRKISAEGRPERAAADDSSGLPAVPPGYEDFQKRLKEAEDKAADPLEANAAAAMMALTEAHAIVIKWRNNELGDITQPMRAIRGYLSTARARADVCEVQLGYRVARFKK